MIWTVTIHSDKGELEEMGPMNGKEAKPSRILVVDDDESLRTVVSQVLTEDGHEVMTARSGEEALEAFRKNPIRWSSPIS
jgi:PleD family two-component response regulator